MPVSGSVDAVRPHAVATARRGRRDRLRRPRRGGTAWLLLTPYLVFLLAFGIGPIVGAVWFSLGGGPLGGAAYRRVFSSILLGPAALDVAEFLVIFLPIMLAVVTAAALVAHSRDDRIGRMARFAYYLPGVVVGAPLVLLWLFMLDPSLSPFGPVLRALGQRSTGDVLAVGHLPLIFAVMAVFTSAGGWVIVLHGALEAVDRDVQEAAALDGCNSWQLALYVKVPAIRRYLAFIAVLSFAGASQLVAEPTIIAQAIPGTVSSTWSLNQLGFHYAFAVNDFAAASVVALILLAVGALAAVVLIYGVRGYSTEDGDG